MPSQGRGFGASHIHCSFPEEIFSEHTGALKPRMNSQLTTARLKSGARYSTKYLVSSRTTQRVSRPCCWGRRWRALDHKPDGSHAFFLGLNRSDDDTASVVSDENMAIINHPEQPVAPCPTHRATTLRCGSGWEYALPPPPSPTLPTYACSALYLGEFGSCSSCFLAAAASLESHPHPLTNLRRQQTRLVQDAMWECRYVTMWRVVWCVDVSMQVSHNGSLPVHTAQPSSHTALCARPSYTVRRRREREGLGARKKRRVLLLARGWWYHNSPVCVCVCVSTPPPTHLEQ